MQQEFRNQLERLRQQFANSLPERAHRLEEIWSHLRHLNWSEQGIAALQQFAHKHVEAGTSFGFPELRLAAQQLEDLLKALQSWDVALVDRNIHSWKITSSNSAK